MARINFKASNRPLERRKGCVLDNLSLAVASGAKTYVYEKDPADAGVREADLPGTQAFLIYKKNIIILPQL